MKTRAINAGIPAAKMPAASKMPLRLKRSEEMLGAGPGPGRRDHRLRPRLRRHHRPAHHHRPGRTHVHPGVRIPPAGRL